MSVALPEQDEKIDYDLSEFEDIEIPCDVMKMVRRGDYGLPPCKDEPAEWVGWRACPCGIKYRLVCDHCKKVYQEWARQNSSIVCSNCGGDTGGFHTFTPLKGGV